MRVNYNVSAMLAQNALRTNDAKYSASTEKLSSGKKINSAKENPAGLALSRRMNAQIRGMQEANKSTANAINVVQTADGALGEIQDILQRMNELADRAATDTVTDVDRKYIQDEIANLKNEVQRIRNTTQFNGQNILDGTFGPKAYSTVNGVTNPAVKTVGYQEVKAEKVTITGLKIDKRWPSPSADDTARNGCMDDGCVELDPTSITIPTKTQVLDENNDPIFKDDVKAEVHGDYVKLYDGTGISITLQIDQAMSGEKIDIEIPGNSAGFSESWYGMATQIGSNEGQRVDIVIPDISINSMGIRFTDCSKVDWAREAIDDIKGAIDYVTRARSNLGAYQNRLEHTLSGLNVNEENMTASYSRIMDTDMAEEMVNYSTLQVMTQAGISMLAQANQRPADLLQLLQ